eukprot:321374-Amorphochlora_amoeboformis.AAC.2
MPLRSSIPKPDPIELHSFRDRIIRLVWGRGWSKRRTAGRSNVHIHFWSLFVDLRESSDKSYRAANRKLQTKAFHHQVNDFNTFCSCARPCRALIAVSGWSARFAGLEGKR